VEAHASEKTHFDEGGNLMKKLLIALLFVCLALSLFAGGEKEPAPAAGGTAEQLTG